LRVDPLLEEIYCEALRAHAALGDRAGLVQRYQDMKQVFAKELEMEPIPATEKLYQKLLRGF